MRLPRFEYFAPKTLGSALSILAEQGDGAHLFAGGTDVMVKMSAGRLKPKVIIHLMDIEGLDGIHFDPTKV